MKKALAVILTLVMVFCMVPSFMLTASATDYITTFGVNMTKICNGVKVSELNVTAKNSTQYTVDSVVCYDVTNGREMTANNTFETGKKYTITVTFTVKEGYEFATDGNTPAQNLVAQINDNQTFDTIEKVYGVQAWCSLEATYTIEKCCKRYIQEVGMNIKEPLAGQFASFSAETDNIVEYMFLMQAPNLETIYEDMINGVRWRDLTGGGCLIEGDKFEIGHTYSLSIFVQTNNDYQFDSKSNLIGKINGKRIPEQDVFTHENGTIVTLNSVYTVYGIIDSMNILLAEPVVGDTPALRAFVEDTHAYIAPCDYIYWKRFDGNGGSFFMNSKEKFEANTEYEVIIHIDMNKDYKLRQDENGHVNANITINDLPADECVQGTQVCVYHHYYLGSNHVHTFILHSNADYHWKQCECGDKIEYEEHVYDNDYDSDCNICGHTRQITATSTFTVSFNKNGGSGTMQSVSGVSGAYYMPACGFTAPEGKQFAGWAIDSTDGAQTLPGLKITVGRNITVYALWEEKTHTHSFSVTVHSPTCTEAGCDEYVCQYCSYTYKDNIVPATGHCYHIDEKLSPTCTDEGYTKYVCSECGHSYIDDCKAKLGHTYNANDICSKCSYWKNQTAAPKISGVTNAAKGITVKWSALKGAEGYFVYRKAPGDTKWKLIASGMSNTTYTDTSVKAGTKYTYTIKAYNGGTNSKYNTTGLSVVRLTNPAVKVANADAGMKVSWARVTGAKSYWVYRKTSSGSYSKIGTTSNLSYVDKTAKAGTKYTYTVRAVNGNDLSAYTGVNTLRLATPSVKVANTKSGPKATWGKVSGATGYIIYRKTSSGSYTKIATVKTTSYVDKTAKKNVKYYYAVRAYSGSVMSAYTNNGITCKK